MKERIIYKLNSYAIISIFSLAIFTPLLLGIYEQDKALSEIEKRKLLQSPPPPKTINDIRTFPQSFSNYYSDHFGLRDWFTSYYKLTKLRMGDSPSKDVTIGKNGWLFLGSIKQTNSNHSDPIGDVRNINLFSRKDLKRFANNMSARKSWLNDKGIEYVFVIAPNKHTIYFDQLPDYITKENDISSTDQVIEYLKKHTKVAVVDLRYSLLNAKEEHQLYYKSDTHWNNFAANIAQYEIMLEIEKLLPGLIRPEIKALKIRTRSGGDLANFIGVSTPEEFDPLPIFEQTCTPKKHILNPEGRTIYTLVCNDQNLNALIFRDSFFQTLEPYFARKFKHTTYIWGKLNYPLLEKYIALEKPEVVIEEWVERSLPYVPKDIHEFKTPQNKRKFDSSDKLLFSNNWKQLKFNKWLNLIDDKNNKLELRATGNDPSISFPSLRIKPDNNYILHVKMTSEIQSTLQVFYSVTNQIGHKFSEKNSLLFSINKGDNDIYIALDDPKLGKYIRLDPISMEGEIVIESLEIKNIGNNLS